MPITYKSPIIPHCIISTRSQSQPDERGILIQATWRSYSQVVGDHADAEYILVLAITRLQEHFWSCVSGSSSHFDLCFRVGIALLVLVQDLR
jgi:CO dehydrogenase/acetyl-CoA synthase epsilon subunit